MTHEEIKKKLKKELQIEKFGKNVFDNITFSLSPSDPNYEKKFNDYVADVNKGEIIITFKWDYEQPANAEEKEDRLADIVNAKDMADVKAETKKIKANATKLPKKKMKLEDFINGQSI